MSLSAYRQAAADYAAAEARVKRFADARAMAVLDMARGGQSVTTIARALGVTRARVSQYLARARALPEQSATDEHAASGVLITDAMLAEARATLAVLRRRIRVEAQSARAASLAILDSADALSITPPNDRSIGEWDWYRGFDRSERARLNRWLSHSPGNYGELVADRLRAALPAFGNYGTDEIISRVWLYHSRMVDAAGYVAKHGRVPNQRCYRGMVDVAAMAPSVAADGYSVAVVLGDTDAAVAHVATVDATRASDDAYRMLGDAATCVHGPPPWRMSADAYTAELLAISAQLRGHDVLERSELDTRARLAELVPKLLDDGRDWPSLHACIVDTARLAALVGAP